MAFAKQVRPHLSPLGLQMQGGKESDSCRPLEVGMHLQAIGASIVAVQSHVEFVFMARYDADDGEFYVSEIAGPDNRIVAWSIDKNLNVSMTPTCCPE